MLRMTGWWMGRGIGQFQGRITQVKYTQRLTRSERLTQSTSSIVKTEAPIGGVEVELDEIP